MGWADLTLGIRGPQCERLGQMLHRQTRRPIVSSLCIRLSGLGGGWRLRRRYSRAFASARRRIDVAHGYFLPDRGLVRSITAAARRGVVVRLLLAGKRAVVSHPRDTSARPRPTTRSVTPGSRGPRPAACYRLLRAGILPGRRLIARRVPGRASPGIAGMR